MLQRRLYCISKIRRPKLSPKSKVVRGTHIRAVEARPGKVLCLIPSFRQIRASEYAC